MNVYDFDNTIYDGDSTADFYLYCLVRYPRIASCIFGQAWGFFLYALGRIDTTEFKERFFTFLRRLPDLDMLVESFWDSKQKKIKRWYLECKRPDDAVISASPEFLLKTICRRLEIAPPIATQLDPTVCKIQGKNCKGNEKVRRFYWQYPDAAIHRFYSDSTTDLPLAVLADEAFFVRGDKIIPWAELQ